MRIYLSASFVAQKRLRPIRDILWTKGHHVVSTWLDEQVQPPAMAQDVFHRKLGTKDIAEIVSCDLFIYDGIEPSTSGGRDTELGVALGRFQHCQVWGVGLTTLNPFRVLMDQRFETWDELLGVLSDA